jgi:hypothetical protein
MQTRSVKVRVQVDILGQENNPTVSVLFALIEPADMSKLGTIILELGLAIRRAELDYGKKDS